MSEKGWRHFLNLVQATTTDPKVLSELFELFLTPEEKASIETRCLIVKALIEQKSTQREMSKDLEVSIAKITRGSNELKRITPKLLSFLKDNF
jgi:TrpR family trp operon transcriptional repressor